MRARLARLSIVIVAIGLCVVLLASGETGDTAGWIIVGVGSMISLFLLIINTPRMIINVIKSPYTVLQDVARYLRRTDG